MSSGALQTLRRMTTGAVVPSAVVSRSLPEGKWLPVNEVLERLGGGLDAQAVLAGATFYGLVQRRGDEVRRRSDDELEQVAAIWDRSSEGLVPITDADGNVRNVPGPLVDHFARIVVAELRRRELHPVSQPEPKPRRKKARWTAADRAARRERVS